MTATHWVSHHPIGWHLVQYWLPHHPVFRCAAYGLPFNRCSVRSPEGAKRSPGGSEAEVERGQNDRPRITHHLRYFLRGCTRRRPAAHSQAVTVHRLPSPLS